MDLDDVTGAVGATELAERAQEAERAHQSYVGPNSAADAIGEVVAQVLWQVVSLPWACVRGICHCVVGTFEVGGEVIAAIFEFIADGF